MLGLVLLRGDEVISLTIEGPPPADESRAGKGQVAPVSSTGQGGKGCPAQHTTKPICLGAAPCQHDYLRGGHCTAVA